MSGNRNRARLIQLDCIEVHILGNVGPALLPKFLSSRNPTAHSLLRRGGNQIVAARLGDCCARLRNDGCSIWLPPANRVAAVDCDY